MKEFTILENHSPNQIPSCENAGSKHHDNNTGLRQYDTVIFILFKLLHGQIIFGQNKNGDVHIDANYQAHNDNHQLHSSGTLDLLYDIKCALLLRVYL